MKTIAVGTHNSNNLDALRLLFAGMVLLSHSIELVTGNRAHEPLTVLFGTISLGELGVDSFFILSGFLITKSFDRDPRPLAFLMKRILRICPAFIVASLISVLIVGALGSSNVVGYFTALSAKQLAYNALTLNVPRVPPTFVGLTSELVNGSMWTVRFEFIGYLAILGLGILGAFKTTARIGFMFMGSLLLYHLYTGRIEGYHLNGMVRFAPMLLSGALFYRSRVYQNPNRSRVGIALTLLLAGMTQPRLAEIAVATAGAYLIFTAGFSAFGGRSILRNKPDISYGIYLYAWPVQMLAIFWGVSQPILVFAVSLAAAGLLGYLSWHLIEKHALEIGQSVKRGGTARVLREA